MLCLIILALLAALLVKADDLSIACNVGKDVHCLYTPVAGDYDHEKNNPKKPLMPDVKVVSGGIVESAVDGAGSTTFLVRDGTALDVFVYCKIGNYQKFRVNFGHTSSSVSAELNANTRSTAYFNDDVNTHVAPGHTISSTTVGVDAVITCP